MKTVVDGREKLPDGSVRVHFNSNFLNFARYYGFESTACHPYWPRAKGKVESGVKYIKSHFLITEAYQKTFFSIEELNGRLHYWIEHTAHMRIHRSTGRKPEEMWDEEKKYLPFPHKPPYISTPLLPRQSTKDALVQYQANLYSVPSKYAFRKLYVRETHKNGFPMLQIFYQDSVIATHKISHERGKWVIDDTHILESKSPAKKGNSKPARQAAQKKRSYRSVKLAERELSYYNSLISSTY